MVINQKNAFELAMTEYFKVRIIPFAPYFTSSSDEK